MTKKKRIAVEMSQLVLDQQIEAGTKLLKALKSADKSTPPEAQTISWIKNRIQILDSNWQKISDRHDNLVTVRQELKDAAYFTGEFYAEYEDAYGNTRAILEDRMAKKERASNPPTAAPPNIVINASTPSAPTATVQLPPAPTFSG